MASHRNLNILDFVLGSAKADSLPPCIHQGKLSIRSVESAHLYQYDGFESLTHTKFNVSHR